jgi:hypothetical protein
MKEQKPQRRVEVVPELLPCNNRPPLSCEVEAMAELMTVRLAELVNAKIERWPSCSELKSLYRPTRKRAAEALLEPI